MIFAKKQKGISLKQIKRLEEGFFDHFDLYFTMYTESVITRNFSKVDNVAVSLSKIYDRKDRINQFYDKQKSVCFDTKEQEFLNSSQSYVLFGTELLFDVISSCLAFKQQHEQEETIQITSKNIIDEFVQRKIKFLQLQKEKEYQLQKLYF